MVTTRSSAIDAPPGYAIRRLTRADLPRVAAFTDLCDQHDIGGADFTLATHEMEWAMPRFDPSKDAWAIETAASDASSPGERRDRRGSRAAGAEGELRRDNDGELVGYTHLTRRPKVAPEAAGWLHPSHRGRGLGSLMVDLTEARVREIVAEPGSDTPLEIVHWTNHVMTDAAALLRSRAYEVTRSFLRMSIAFGDQEPPAPEWPDGVELRPMRVGIDDEAVYTTISTAFRDHWGNSPLPFPQWRELRMGNRLFDPTLWLLAWSGDRLVGAALDLDEDGEAWVQTLGVLREARGKGVGRALLFASFREFHRRGHRQVCLGVDAESLTGATRLYENAGMTADRQWDHWERKLD